MEAQVLGNALTMVTTPWLIGLFLLLIFSMITAAVVILAIVFSPENIHKRALKAQAKQDYLQARGTVHRRLLSQTQRQIQRELNQVDKVLAKDKVRLGELQTNQAIELDKALNTWLVRTQLQTVKGIGESRKQTILAKVFDGRLESLYLAHQIPGIGPQTQAAIRAWVLDQQRQISLLRAGPFPHKNDIVANYRPQIQQRQQTIKQLEARQALLNERQQQLAAELSWLKKVNQKDFAAALITPAERSPLLDRYVQGVFAEWEPMPAWLTAILADTNVNQ